MTLGNFANQPYVELYLIDKALVVICLDMVPTLTVFVWCQIRSLLPMNKVLRTYIALADRSLKL